jgi:dihydroxyacetone kinase
MLDAIVPFADALTASPDQPLADSWRRAVAVATQAADATAKLVARRGRSRIHGDRSLGTPDPGALSFALIVRAVEPR